MRTAHTEPARIGIIAAAGAYAIWGLFPLYLQLLSSVPSGEILAHRAFWACLLTLSVMLIGGRLRRIRAILTDPHKRRLIIGSALVISINWLVFIYAVATEQVLQSSLGYFLFPLVTVALAVVFLKERLTKRQAAALVLVSLGVAIMVWRVGVFPWISIVLAISFSFYGLFRKIAAIDAVDGLATETLMMIPFAAIAMVLFPALGFGAFAHGMDMPALLSLIGMGALTVLPLLLFAAAANRLRLATVGLMQFINPTIQFVFAVFVFAEPFGQAHLASFGTIWIGLLVYAWPSKGR